MSHFRRFRADCSFDRNTLARAGRFPHPNSGEVPAPIHPPWDAAIGIESIGRFGREDHFNPVAAIRSGQDDAGNPVCFILSGQSASDRTVCPVPPGQTCPNRTVCLILPGQSASDRTVCLILAGQSAYDRTVSACLTGKSETNSHTCIAISLENRGFCPKRPKMAKKRASDRDARSAGVRACGLRRRLAANRLARTGTALEPATGTVAPRCKNHFGHPAAPLFNSDGNQTIHPIQHTILNHN